VPPQPATRNCACSREVLSPTALSDIRSPLTLGFPHPVRCAFRFSQPLSAFLLRTPLGPVSADNALGVLPSEPFPCNQPGYPLGSTCPLAVSSSTQARLQGLQPIAEPFLSETWLGSRRARYSLGFLPLQGILTSRARTLAGPSSHRLISIRLAVPDVTPFRGLMREKFGLTLPSLPPLLRFTTLSSASLPESS
jgi:hypothetical protein